MISIYESDKTLGTLAASVFIILSKLPVRLATVSPQLTPPVKPLYRAQLAHRRHLFKQSLTITASGRALCAPRGNYAGTCITPLSPGRCMHSNISSPETAPAWVFQLFVTGLTTVTGVQCGASTVTQYYSPYPGIFDDAYFGYTPSSTTPPPSSPLSTSASTTDGSTSQGGSVTGGGTTDVPPSSSSSSTQTTTGSDAPAPSNSPNSNSKNQSTALQKQSNKIALGCGLGIGLPALLVGIVTYIKLS